MLYDIKWLFLFIRNSLCISVFHFLCLFYLVFCINFDCLNISYRSIPFFWYIERHGYRLLCIHQYQFVYFQSFMFINFSALKLFWKILFGDVVQWANGHSTNFGHTISIAFWDFFFTSSCKQSFKRKYRNSWKCLIKTSGTVLT